MPTIRLVYSSTASVEMPYASLVDIMDHAEARNVGRGITGILCYGSGHFLQALEGEREAVSTLYHRIAADPRHHDCQLIAVTDIDSRAFPEWTMKVVNWESGETARRRAMLKTRIGAEVFDPTGMTGAEATRFLSHLADIERELAAG